MVGVVAIAAFAAVDEWHQEFVPGRAADPIDWAADVVGAAAGLIVATTTLRTEQRI
jgi:VanZ family protein